MAAFPQGLVLRAPDSMELIEIIPALRSQSIAGIVQTRVRGILFFKFILSYDLLTREDFNILSAFYSSTYGMGETFTFTPPLYETSLGGGGGTPVVEGSAQTGNTLNTSGWTPASTVLKAGDFINIAGTTKVYKVLEDVISGGTGLATLKLAPNLLEAPVDNASITTENVLFTCTFINPTLEAIAIYPNFFSATVEMQEYIPAV